jgi:hypothetical protein
MDSMTRPSHRGDEPDPGEETVEQLMLDLQNLADAGFLVEIRKPGQPSRYALSAVAHDLGPAPAPDSHTYPIADWPEPCPACGATEGFDGGARCYRCHVAWPPEM